MEGCPMDTPGRVDIIMCSQKIHKKWTCGQRRKVKIRSYSEGMDDGRRREEVLCNYTAFRCKLVLFYLSVEKLLKLSDVLIMFILYFVALEPKNGYTISIVFQSYFQISCKKNIVSVIAFIRSVV